MFRGVAAEPEDIAAMTVALEAYCDRNGLHDMPERGFVATRIVGLFGQGNLTVEALLKALDMADSRQQDDV